MYMFVSRTDQLNIACSIIEQMGKRNTYFNRFVPVKTTSCLMVFFLCGALQFDSCDLARATTKSQLGSVLGG